MGTIKIKDAEGNWVGLPNYGIQQFPDAPSDGKTYGRKDGTWNEVDNTLDVTWLFKLMVSPGTVTSITKEQLALIEDAFNRNISAAYVQADGAKMIYPANITGVDGLEYQLSILQYEATTEGKTIMGSYTYTFDPEALTFYFGSSAVQLSINGNGNKFLSDSGEYKEVTASSEAIFEIPSAVGDLTNDSTSEEILNAIGGEEGFNKLMQAVNDKKPLSILIGDGNMPLMLFSTIYVPLSFDDTFGVQITFVAAGTSLVMEIIKYSTEFHYSMIDGVELRDAGDGTKFLADDGKYKEISGGSKGVAIPSTFLELVLNNIDNTQAITTEDILNAIGGEAKYQEILTAIENNESVYFKFNLSSTEKFSILSQCNVSAINDPELESGFSILLYLSAASILNPVFTNINLYMGLVKTIDGTWDGIVNIFTEEASYRLPDSIVMFNDGLTSEEISNAIGGSVGFDNLLAAINDKKQLYVRFELDRGASSVTISTLDCVYSYVVTADSYTQIDLGFMVEGTHNMVSITRDSSGNFSANSQAGVSFKNDGIGNYYLADDGNYKHIPSIEVSTRNPSTSDGAEGDIWIKYTA